MDPLSGEVGAMGCKKSSVASRLKKTSHKAVSSCGENNKQTTTAARTLYHTVKDNESQTLELRHTLGGHMTHYFCLYQQIISHARKDIPHIILLGHESVSELDGHQTPFSRPASTRNQRPSTDCLFSVENTQGRQNHEVTSNPLQRSGLEHKWVQRCSGLPETHV